MRAIRRWAEYDAFGADFSTRSRRIEEQVDVLRRLLSEPIVTFSASDSTDSLNPILLIANISTPWSP